MYDLSPPLPRVLLEGHAEARALLRGNNAFLNIWGDCLFYPFQEGSLVFTRVLGLPENRFFGLSIHENGDCRTGGDIPFFPAGDRFDPQQGRWSEEAGVLPPLLGNGGQALSLCYTGRFRPCDVMGRSVLVHLPSETKGSCLTCSGGAIACGVILRLT